MLFTWLIAAFIGGCLVGAFFDEIMDWAKDMFNRLSSYVKKAWVYIRRVPGGNKQMDQTVYLTLQNGQVFQGKRFGADADVTGELVFTTGMVGYLETLTDPSYCGQIVLQTFPLIGNYGVIPADFRILAISADSVAAPDLLRLKMINALILFLQNHQIFNVSAAARYRRFFR